MESRKIVLMNLFSGQHWRNTQNRPMDTRKGEEGEGEADGESNMETYNIVCRIDSQ